MLVFFLFMQVLSAQASSTADVHGFLDWYWQRPLAQQEESYDIGEQSKSPLAPESCGLCHPDQLADWQTSRHAQAMSPGVLGQLLAKLPENNQACLDCHAPLHEQAESLAQELTVDDDTTPTSGTSISANALHKHGVMCSACHLRNYRWFGPPRHYDLPPLEPMQAQPHAGWTPHNAFRDSRFCAACHQFPKDGYALNGKLIENTYEEWKASPQAQQGLTCQGCHMPDRRHLWRGIHDRATVRAGVDIRSSPVTFSGGAVSVNLSLTNSGTGHSLPTYVTPKIVLQIYQEDQEGKKIEATAKQYVIARSVSLDLSIEYFDTRLSPGEMANLPYKRPVSPDAINLVTNVWVEPDAFYSLFYQALLESELPEKSKVLIQQALTESLTSGFSIHNTRHPILLRHKNAIRKVEDTGH